ncbi:MULTISPECIES: hypothetical protein [unclassified Novosphingobium]|uniref:hypothetical protein n=1 Tax=unclassified Novosphingobium TaxID=2644732 RepID=UPI001F3949D7|nr:MULTISPECIES: hypothetical protein [unclassified Novosphingobium]
MGSMYLVLSVNSGIDERVPIVAGAIYRIIAHRDGRRNMTASFTSQDWRDHFAHCIQVFGGTTASSRRLGIDERAIRRFINGDLPLSPRLLEDTAKALRLLIVEATQAEGHIAAAVGSEANDPQA